MENIKFNLERMSYGDSLCEGKVNLRGTEDIVNLMEENQMNTVHLNKAKGYLDLR